MNKETELLIKHYQIYKKLKNIFEKTNSKIWDMIIAVYKDVPQKTKKLLEDLKNEKTDI